MMCKLSNYLQALHNSITVFITYEEVSFDVSISIIITNIQNEQMTIIFISLVYGIDKG